MSEESILVAVRVRPLLKAEQEESPEECIRTHDDKGVISIKKEANEARKALLSPAAAKRSRPAGDTDTMAFDRVWGPVSTQEAVFEQVRPLVDSAFEGYNSTVFAYGPSGSGKTHTMIGSAGAPGIVPRAVERVLQLAKAQPQQMFVFVLSVLELYNDHFYDLLEGCSPASTGKRRQGASAQGFGAAKKIEVVRNGKSSHLRGDYTKMHIDSAEVAISAIEAGLSRRSTSGTQLNDRSSRSHAVVILQAQQATVERRASSGSVYHTSVRSSNGSAAASGLTTVGTLYMVDLAGSERVKVSGVAGDEFEEAKHINKSLSALGNVLTALSSKTRGAVVPYRDSKLTLLLQDALGGNSKTMMITCVNAKKESYAYSSVALQFAVRAKTIKNFAHVNLDADKTSEIEALKAEIYALRRRLDDRQVEFDAVSGEAGGGANSELSTEQYDKVSQLLAINEREKQELEGKLAHVINGSALVQQRERAAYERLQSELSAYSDKLLQAQCENEAKESRILELEAARASEAKDKEEHLQARLSLERRNVLLERRVRELEAASGAGWAGSPRSNAPAALVPSAKVAMVDSPYHCRHTPVARSPAEKALLEERFPAMKGRVLVALEPPREDAGAREAQEEDGRWHPRPPVPDSPGDILVRNLDTGETLPAKQILSRLSVGQRLASAKNRMLSPLRSTAASQSLRTHGAWNAVRQTSGEGKAGVAAARQSDVDMSVRELLSPTSLRKRDAVRGLDGDNEAKRACHESPEADGGRPSVTGRARGDDGDVMSLFSPGRIESAFLRLTSDASSDDSQLEGLAHESALSKPADEAGRHVNACSFEGVAAAGEDSTRLLASAEGPVVQAGCVEGLGATEMSGYVPATPLMQSSQNVHPNTHLAGTSKNEALFWSDREAVCCHADALSQTMRRKSTAVSADEACDSHEHTTDASGRGKRSSLSGGTERLEQLVGILSKAKSATLTRLSGGLSSMFPAPNAQASDKRKSSH